MDPSEIDDSPCTLTACRARSAEDAFVLKQGEGGKTYSLPVDATVVSSSPHMKPKRKASATPIPDCLSSIGPSLDSPRKKLKVRDEALSHASLDDTPSVSPIVKLGHSPHALSTERSYADATGASYLATETTSHSDMVVPDGVDTATSGPPSRALSLSPLATIEHSAQITPPALVASSSRIEDPPNNATDTPRIDDRRRALAEFTIPSTDGSLLRLRVSRKELLEGSMRIPAPRPCATVTLDGKLRDFLFTTFEYQPLDPRSPGKAGLLYCANDVFGWRDCAQTVFVQSKRSVYQYVGEYALSRAPPLSVAEFKTWTPKLKKTWATCICDRAKFHEIWARAVLRDRFGRAPTAQEIKTEIEARTARQMATRDAVGSSKEKRKTIYDPTDVEKIVKAYEDGDEEMGVWNMVCVGFDVQLLAGILQDRISPEAPPIRNVPAENSLVEGYSCT